MKMLLVALLGSALLAGSAMAVSNEHDPHPHFGNEHVSKVSYFNETVSVFLSMRDCVVVGQKMASGALTSKGYICGSDEDSRWAAQIKTFTLSPDNA